MPDILFFILCGAGVGLAVGMTGVGGGSLMTPLLIFSGVPTNIAIGTDLLYAAATKSGAMYAHNRRKTIKWDIVLLLAAGSIPTSILTSIFLKYWASSMGDYTTNLEISLGIMLVITSLVLLFKRKISGEAHRESEQNQWIQRHSKGITFSAGIFLGVFVTLSSVGAGAFCAALLLILCPRMPAINVIGTDIAHAVPLTLVAGIGHFWNQNIDWWLLLGLLIGSLPAVHVGARLAVKIPNGILQKFLATLLLVIGLKFIFAR